MKGTAVSGAWGNEIVRHQKIDTLLAEQARFWCQADCRRHPCECSSERADLRGETGALAGAVRPEPRAFATVHCPAAHEAAFVNANKSIIG